jgi:hypothetical protein
MYSLQLTLANLITPFLNSQLLHLLVGNVFIGILEGLIIALVFKVRAFKAMIVMIIANYLSAAAAFGLFGVSHSRGPFVPLLFDEPLYQITLILWLGFGVALGLSLLIEWPLVLALFKDSTAKYKRSLQAVLLAQIASYTCLVPAYWLGGDNALGREVTVVRSLDFVPEDLHAAVYFIDPDHTTVRRMSLSGSASQAIATVTEQERVSVREYRPPFLYVAQQGADEFQTTVTDGLYETLPLELRYFGYRRPYFERVITPLTGRAGLAHYIDLRIEYDDVPAMLNQMTFGSLAVTDFRDPAERDWMAAPRFYFGVIFEQKSTGERYMLTFQSVFDTWAVRNVTLLPGDIAVFEFGGQICVLDINQRKIALLAMGWGPVVEFDD